LALLSILAGAAAGLVAALFRLSLAHASDLRNAAIRIFLAWGVPGLLLLVAIVAIATAAAAWLVRRFAPEATGSGIPEVELVLTGEKGAAPAAVVPVKFAGGLLAIGGGLALGREGPTIQMGATVADLLGTAFRRSREDCAVLLAAGAGAGLAAAFSAPIAGAVFVLEELVRRFNTRIAIAALGASASAIAVSRIFLGDATVFHLGSQPSLGFGSLPASLGLGIAAGLLGAAYNKTILGVLNAATRIRAVPVELRAAFIGVAAGALAWLAPSLVGDGEGITQSLLAGAWSVSAVAVALGVRFFFGPFCYAADTPGGLFAPMLVLGAQVGWLWAAVFQQQPTAMAIVGMAAFFTAVVRAPVTGIVLVTEMTGSGKLLLPILSACFGAMAVAELLRSSPIYDSLRERASEPLSR
jgi:CIC family chloride channel protein